MEDGVIAASLVLALQQSVSPEAPPPSPHTSASPLLWTVFLVVVVGLLALDLFVVNRRAREIRMREAALAGVGWVLLALLFGLMVYFKLNADLAAKFLTGYVIELSLSVDNLFVFLVLFRFFKVEKRHQHRVLFWGIMGALVLRAVFILAGTALIERWHWVTYLFGILLVLTGIKLLKSREEEIEPERNVVLRIARRFLPISQVPHEGRFTLVEDGKRKVTTLFLCLVTVEATDVVFAVDSIPAIFGVTLDRFVIYTSNVFAILGLRSFFLLIALLVGAFRYLGVGLALVLLFIGAKMLAAGFDVHVPTLASLGIVLGTLLCSVLASIVIPKKPEEKREEEDEEVEESEEKDEATSAKSDGKQLDSKRDPDREKNAGAPRETDKSERE
jgi:tellurite resistance protein TerC